MYVCLLFTLRESRAGSSLHYCVALQHWVRLEMQPDILISLLTMSVEPTDSSYMPSLLTISGGNSVQSLHELRTVTVEPNDRRVVLLDTLTQVTYSLE